jgi:hypothetical protein
MHSKAIREIRLEIRGKIGRDCFGDPVKPDFVCVRECESMPRRLNEIIDLGLGESVEVVANLIGRDKSGKCVYELR